MPKPLQYKAGSLIYYRGEAAERVMILHSGKVSLVLKDLETGEDIRDQVQAGEFFGVKSALGRFPREENAIAVADSTVMAFTVPEFEALAISNTRIIMKMLKVFSNQMRRVHAQVSSLLETEEEMKPEDGLFALGAKYLKNRQFSNAKYVFSQYLIHYPTGANAEQAVKNLKIAESNLGGASAGKKPLPKKPGGA
jgi:CRP-like cAMP-binding protein